MTSSSGGKLVPLPPDGGWGWIVVLGSFFIHVFADGFVYSFGVLVEPLMEEFAASNTFSSMIISLLTGLTLGSGPVASAVCNKYGCRSTAIAGSAIAFVGCLCSFFATAMWHIVVSVGIIMGIGFGLMYCPAIVIVTMYFENKRSLATGIAVAGAGVGTMLFAPINAHLITNYGWRSVFLAFLVVLVLCSLCGAAFAPLKFAVVEEEEEETGEKEKSRLLKEKESKKRPASVTSVDFEPESHSRAVGERDNGYLNRKDVFFTGSISNVAEFREHPDHYRSTGSLHKIERTDDVYNNGIEISENVEGKNMFKTVSDMLSLPLLLDTTFLLFVISNLLTSVGFNSPLYFLPLHATNLKLTKEEGSQVLSVFGVTNTIGRVVFGVIADHKLPLPYGIGNDTARNRLWMYNISLTICGILTMFCGAFDGFYALATYAALFGYSIASYICLTSVILVDLLGLERLTNAFGLLLLWQGIGTVFGPPVSGYLADYSGDYKLSFVFCGVNLMISGLMLFGIPFFQKKNQKESVPTC